MAAGRTLQEICPMTAKLRTVVPPPPRALPLDPSVPPPSLMSCPGLPGCLTAISFTTGHFMHEEKKGQELGAGMERGEERRGRAWDVAGF